MKKQFKKYAALCAVLPCLLINSLSLTTSAISVNLSGYGDVNGDGSVNVFDISLIQGGNLTTKQKVYADLNADGVVNNDDINIIVDINIERNQESVSKYQLSWYSRYGNVPVTSRYGDVDFNGTLNVIDINLIYQYLNGKGTLSPRQRVYADLNANGYVDSEDADLIKYIYLETNENLIETSRSLWYHLYQPILAMPGDVDQDNQISVEDAVSILTYYAKQSAGLSVNYKTFCGMAAGDVNYDGIISVEDAVQVLTYYAKKSAGLSPDWE